MSIVNPLPSDSAEHELPHPAGPSLHDALHQLDVQHKLDAEHRHDAPPQRKHKYSIGLVLFTLATIGAIVCLKQIGLGFGSASASAAPLENGVPSDAEMKRLLASRNAARWNVTSIACHEQEARKTDWCQLTDKQGTVLFKGDFLPVGSIHRAPQSRLQIAPFDTLHGWVRGPSEHLQVPVIPLKDGTLLVPAGDTFTLKRRWAAHPEELAAVSQVNVPAAPTH